MPREIPRSEEDPEDRALTERDDEALAILEEEMRQAGEAQALLNHPLLKRAFERIEDKWSSAWRSSQFADSEGREKAYRILGALEEF